MDEEIGWGKGLNFGRSMGSTGGRKARERDIHNCVYRCSGLVALIIALVPVIDAVGFFLSVNLVTMILDLKLNRKIQVQKKLISYQS